MRIHYVAAGFVQEVFSPVGYLLVRLGDPPFLLTAVFGAVLLAGEPSLLSPKRFLGVPESLKRLGDRSTRRGKVIGQAEIETCHGLIFPYLSIR